MSLGLPTPDEFPAFPYNPPYDIQVELMRHVYKAIEGKEITIVESPTGTGKTLTLLCSSLTWLRDEKNRAKIGKLNKATTDDGNTKRWVIEQTRERLMRELEVEEEVMEERLRQARKREAALRKVTKGRVTKKPRQEPSQDQERKTEKDEDFLPDDEDELCALSDEPNISPALRDLMAKVDGKAKGKQQQEQDEEPVCTKIYYASRTHSQLAQVLPELARLKVSLSVQSHHPETMPHSNPLKRSADDYEMEEEEKLGALCSRTVSLGSRKQLCINDKLKSRSKDLDEACRELLSEKGEKRCEFLPPLLEDFRMVDFRDQVLAEPKDIEDLAEAGRASHICPYFGARRAIPQSELVTLPYNLLLQKSAREALGIDLTNQIVIVDEAHNLISTILSLSTCRLPARILSTAFSQVCQYVSRFRNRLAPRHMVQLKRLVVFLDALTKYLVEWIKARSAPESKTREKAEVVTAAGLLERLRRKATAVNLLEVGAYLSESKIARKISGYCEKEAQTGDEAVKRPGKGAIPPLQIVETFMLSLTGANDDGRITISLVGSPDHEEAELKYQLLNPEPQFLEVVEAARCVVLAGGTMSPVSDVINQLFSNAPADRISTFSCGHIIPASNLQALVLKKGPSGSQLEYKAEKKDDPGAIRELGQTISNLLNVVPSGIVVFFSSYSFLNAVKKTWSGDGTIAKFGLKKKVFYEPEDSNAVEQTLNEYADAVRSQVAGRAGGAILFAVIGAKLSEGLNFSDDLARAVIIVGMPYPNRGSPELRERMDYVSRQQEKRLEGNTKRESGKRDAGMELYENLCMNAVNQSIGRAIRHRDDWASLILLDHRYSNPAIRNKLSKWIGNSVIVADTFGQAFKEIGRFYRQKKA
ncbi:DNA repair helicase [Pluteus cervinus]|uniref:DNA repair helicase n=1 Tax=Pluteus cervinus TaxID=181527 RepID=A0ACD3AYH3_9AGAR|nr:DNA repair helicase [Pluteus cervinus]